MEEHSYPPMSDIKIDACNETVLSGESERKHLVDQPKIIVAPICRQ
jgi:hypothetical protein